MSDLQIIHEAKNGWQILRLDGEVDRTTFQSFEQVVVQFAEDPHVKLRLDLQNVRYINSTGLGLLMATYRHLQQGGGDLRIINLSERLRAIFDFLGWFRFFQKDEDSDEDDDEGTAGVVARI